MYERLDNLPLALELAAARTKLFSTEQLLARVGQRLDLFKGGRDADPRQRTLRATIEWSHDLLTAEEQQLFARLSVFAGGCEYEAAEKICAADEDTLQSLLDKSLLSRRAGSGGESRYWMLETIRQFAAERLDDQGESDAQGTTHAEWHAELAQRLQAPLKDGDPEAAGRLAAEIDNVRGALEWFTRHGDIRQALRIVDGLWYFWITRGLSTEGLRWARWAMAEAPKAPARERVSGLLAASELFRFFGDADFALQLKRELLPQLHELGAEDELAAALADMANMLAMAGEFGEARQKGSEALALRRKLGVQTGIARELATQGSVEFLAGDFTRARDLYDEAARLFEEGPVSAGLAGALLMAGEAARRSGDFSGAAPLLVRALQLFCEIGHRFVFPELLQEIAATATAQPVVAVQLLGSSECLLTEVGVQRWDPIDYGQVVARLRADVGDAAFEAAWAAGAALPEDDAMSLAARCLDSVR